MGANLGIDVLNDEHLNTGSSSKVASKFGNCDDLIGVNDRPDLVVY